MRYSVIIPATVGIIVFGTKERKSAVARGSVREDWSARLPASKKELFDAIVRQYLDRDKGAGQA